MYSSLSRILALSLVLAVLGCAATKRDWDHAQQLNTVESYQSFLRKYPQSEFAVEAKARIEELNWIEAQQLNTEDSYQAFLGKYSQSKFAVEARRRLDDICFRQATAENTPTSYAEFLKRFPNSEKSQEARRRLLRLYLTSDHCLQLSFKGVQANQYRELLVGVAESVLWGITLNVTEGAFCPVVLTLSLEHLGGSMQYGRTAADVTYFSRYAFIATFQTADGQVLCDETHEIEVDAGSTRSGYLVEIQSESSEVARRVSELLSQLYSRCVGHK